MSESATDAVHPRFIRKPHHYVNGIVLNQMIFSN